MKRLALVLVVLVALAIAWRLGVFAHVEDARALTRAIVDMGPLGYLVFVVAFAALQPFGVPGLLFVVAAPHLWPWPIAFVLSLVATMAATTIGFSFARFVARDWIAMRIPARLQKYDEALARDAFFTVVMLRLVFLMSQALHSFMGISRVPFWTHFWGSLVGYVPPLFAITYLSAEMFDDSGSLRPGAWRVLVAVLASSLALALAVRALARWRGWRRGSPT